MSELKPCPCGKTPKFLEITGDEIKWKAVSGNCCGEWVVEFMTLNYSEGEEMMSHAIKEWNLAARSTEHQWIPVGTRLPEKLDWYRIAIDGLAMVEQADAIYSESIGGWVLASGKLLAENVTHWMNRPPNPTPPIAENNDES